MKKFFRNNGLSLTLFGFFFLFMIGQAVAGFYDFNGEREKHGQAPLAFSAYLISGHFLEAVFENWESEFLQMGVYVVFTVFLFQKGSAESNDPDKSNGNAGRGPGSNAKAPWPVCRGGWVLRLYENSLSIAFLTLFLVSFVGHVLAGGQHYNEERLQQGQSAVTSLEYMKSSRFWFESFQNWQSEFLAVLAIVLLSIWLRQKGSPESKPVAASHDETGD
jgi:hypothetical protein